MWEEDPQVFLGDIALLPFATLAAATKAEQLLSRVAIQVSMIESSEQRREIATRAQLLAGLRFDKTLIQQLFRGEGMRESVIYQDIFQQGEQKGEIKLVLRQLNRRFGVVPADLQVQIQALSTTQLENLGDALLDFSELADLVTWLQAHS